MYLVGAGLSKISAVACTLTIFITAKLNLWNTCLYARKGRGGMERDIFLFFLYFFFGWYAIKKLVMYQIVGRPLYVGMAQVKLHVICIKQCLII